MASLSNIFILLVFFTFSAQADTNSIDKMLREANQIRSSNPDQFNKTLELLELEKNNFTQSQDNFFSYLSIYKDAFSGKIGINSAIEKLKTLLESTKDNAIKFRILSSIVNYYSIARDYYNGQKYLYSLFDMRGQINDKELTDNSYIIAGLFFNQSEQYKLANNTASDLIIRKSTKRNECIARQIFIESEFKQHNVFSDYSYVDDSIIFCDAINEKVASGLIITIKAKSLINQGNINEASEVLTENKNKILSSKYPPVIAHFNASKAKILSLEGNYSESNEYAKLSLENSNNFGFLASIVEAYEVLYKNAEAEGKITEALDFYKKYSEAEKAYLDDVKARQFAVQQAKLETLEKENQIALLDKENALLKTQAELANKQSQNERLALALVTLFTIMLIIWAYRSRRFQKQFRKMAQTDELTGIANRGHFTEQAQHQLTLCRKTNQPLSFIIFDLDHFKLVNDTYGHQIGDWVLKMAVKAAHLQCRKNDIIGRIGGEEFGILLPSCELNKAMQLAESCRAAIAAINTKECDYKFQLTASFGVASTTSYSYNFDTLFAAADDALYQSKHAGRNKVYCAEPDNYKQQ